MKFLNLVIDEVKQGGVFSKYEGDPPNEVSTADRSGTGLGLIVSYKNNENQPRFDPPEPHRTNIKVDGCHICLFKLEAVAEIVCRLGKWGVHINWTEGEEEPALSFMK